MQAWLERTKFTFPLLLIAVWTAFGLFFGTQNYVRDVYSGRVASFPGYLVGWLLCGYSWGILTPVVLRFLRRFSFSSLGLSRFLLVHLPAALVFASLQLAIYKLIVGMVSLFGSENRPIIEFYEWLFVKEFQSSLLVYAAIAATVSVYDWFVARPHRERRARTARGAPLGATGDLRRRIRAGRRGGRLR